MLKSWAPKLNETLHLFYAGSTLVFIQLLRPLAVARLTSGCTISKRRASVLSGYPNTEKQMKARGRRQFLSRCLDTLIKHEAWVLEVTSHDHSQTNHKQNKNCLLSNIPSWIISLSKMFFTSLIQFAYIIRCNFFWDVKVAGVVGI